MALAEIGEDGEAIAVGKDYGRRQDAGRQLTGAERGRLCISAVHHLMNGTIGNTEGEERRWPISC